MSITSPPWQRWKSDRTLAHIVPLVAFQLLQLLTMTGTNNPAMPWHVRAPEQWVYPLQALVCAAMVWWWWPHYRFDRPRAGAIGLAVAAGLAGIALWILPCEIFHRCGFTESSAGALKFLGVQARMNGFDPADAPWPLVAVVLRFFRMVLVVAIIEEVFWRGFLMRWLVDPDRPVWSIPFGTHHWRAMLGTVVAVALVHQPADYAAALAWGVLLYLVAVRTRSLAACVIAHAVANLVLGVHVMQSGRYGFW
jgi:hypothetical protein